MKGKPIFLTFSVMLFFITKAYSQIPVEIFGGYNRATIDVMFFKFFKQYRQEENGKPQRWLFFNRNRAGVDYMMNSSNHLPQFGFTEAISYNHEQMKGFAPVIVAQVLNQGVFPKAGIQYAHIRENATIFTWLVCETMREADVDYFLLLRYTPNITEKVKLFTQVESINSFPVGNSNQYNLAQRIRLGIQYHGFQLGAGFDFAWNKNPLVTKSLNIGGFIRHEF